MTDARITPLSPSVVGLIAAGEVIERPAAALKELLENSMDAGADDIDVVLEGGGAGLLRVQDNGGGIVGADLPLALARHATSKISTAEDLPLVETFGFRGEALSSLAAVAEVTIESRVRGEAHGWRVVAGEDMPSPLPMQNGTSITARAMFADVPARRRFLRTDSTEAGHCAAVATQVALSSPALALRLSVNGRTRFSLPAADLDERLTALFPSLAGNTLPLSESAAELSLRGVIFAPSLGGSGRRFGQFFYVNGRYVRDRLLRRALGECLRNIAHDGEPGYVLFLRTPPDMTDINVHPAKLEVRFIRPRAVFDFIRRAVNKTLARPLGAPLRDDNWRRDMPSLGVSSAGAPGTAAAPPGAPFGASFGALPSFSAGTASASFADNFSDAPSSGDAALLDADAAQPLGRALGQMHDIYIIAENGGGLVVVDMHAAHERILYEELKAAAANMPMQQFLTPVEIPLTDLQAATLRECGDLLTGIAARLSDSRTARVTAVGVLLAGKTDAGGLLTEVLDALADFGSGGEAEARRDRVLSTVACHAAVCAPTGG